MTEPTLDDSERRRQEQLLQQRRLEEEEDEEEELRRRRSANASTSAGPRQQGQEAHAPSPNWLSRPQWRPEAGGTTASAAAPASTVAPKGGGAKGSSKLIVAGSVLAIAAAVAWWASTNKSSPAKALDAKTSALVAETTTQSVLDAASATTKAIKPLAAADVTEREFEIDESQWRALMDSTKGTETRLGGIEGELASIKEVLTQLQAQVERLPTAAVRYQQTNTTAKPRTRATPAAVVEATPKSQMPPDAVPAAPSPQLLAVDIWDGKPSVVVQGTDDQSKQALRFLTVGDRAGNVTLRSADPRSQRAIFELPGGEVIIEREER